MRRPLIGITTSELRTPPRRDPDAAPAPARREFALGFEYPQAISAAGGAPVILPPLVEPAGAVVSYLDAIVIAGGPDIDPTMYGSDPIPELGPTEPAVDRWERRVIDAARARDLPLLAICRGMQLLNVSFGGHLWQDLPAQLGSDGHHRQKQVSTDTTHTVDVVAGTTIGRLIGSGTLEVNSFHHQAVREVGSGLSVVATTPDGLVEAIESPDHTFMVGVQWHAETLHARGPHLALFEGLVEAARRKRLE